MTDATCGRIVKHRDGTEGPCVKRPGHKSRCYTAEGLLRKTRSKKAARDADRDLERAKNRAYYAKNREQGAAKGRAFLEKRRRWWQVRLNSYKIEKGCARCGYDEHPAALEFDHIDRSVKEFNISVLTTRLSQYREEDINQMWTEVAKCQVLCSNCHRIKTWEEQDSRPLVAPPSGSIYPGE